MNTINNNICIIIFALLSQTAFAQSFTKTISGIKTTVKGTEVEVQFFTPTIARIIKYPAGSLFKKESLSVIKKPQSVKFAIKQVNNNLLLTTTAVQVQINLTSGKIDFNSLAGGKLFGERKGGASFTPIKDGNMDSYQIHQSFVLDKDEAIYGLGQQQSGVLNQRGQTINLLQENMKVCIPFFQSVKGYGVFWDNYSPSSFTDVADSTSFNSQVGKGVDYYFMWGKNADGVIAQMRDLTGQSPMLPLWVYGYNQSKEHYHTQFEIVDVVKKYRSLNVPIDGIIQDWQYWGRDSVWNAQTWDARRYPQPKEMVDSVHQLNAHLFVVTWPGFGPLTKQYKEFHEKNMVIPFDTWPYNHKIRIYDVYNPEARAIYWRYLNAGVFSLGVDAWWMDSSEPDHFNQKEEDFNQSTFLGSFRSVRNAFPLEHIGGVYTNQRATSNIKRVTILTRSAFAGQQRYGANTWSGDVGSTWEAFRNQIPAGLNFSSTAIPYWNTDIGGFFAGHFRQGGGAKNPDFQELYSRWLQFATFTPMMRSHGADVPREIYQFGKPGDATFEVLKKFIKLRYTLLPYNYSTAWQVTNKSGSFLRPLYMDFPTDKAGLNIGGQFMYGKSILVAPVAVKGAKELDVYLPFGTSWFDFWTGEVQKGGQTVKRQTPMDIMPLYVKAGSILPFGPDVQYASEKKWDDLEIRIYPGANGKFLLYEDENDGYNYEKGKYTEIPFLWDNASRTLTIGKRIGSFNGMLAKRKFNIIMVKGASQSGSTLIGKNDKVITYVGNAISVKL